MQLKYLSLLLIFYFFTLTGFSVTLDCFGIADIFFTFQILHLIVVFPNTF